MELKEIAFNLAKVIVENKGEDVILLDVSGLTTIASYMIIATAQSTAHLYHLDDLVTQKGLEFGLVRINAYSDKQDPWRLVDFDDIIIHLFLPKTREFYQLEKLWVDAIAYNVSFNTSSENQTPGEEKSPLEEK